MKTLLEIVNTECCDHKTLLLAAMDSANVSEWADLKKIDSFKDIRNYLLANCKSGCTYAAMFAAAIAPYEDEAGAFAKNWRSQLEIDPVKSQQTYLSLRDIRSLAGYVTHCRLRNGKANELATIVSMLIEARTGARLSDVKDVDQYNVGEDGMLTYKSKKTNVFASIPATPELMFLLRLNKTLNVRMSDVGYNKSIRRIAKNAGIDYKIKLNDVVAEKWEFLSSHDCRRGFCTNLHLGGEELLTISRMAGHSNTAMTERYIWASRRPEAERYDYFRLFDEIVRKEFSFIMTDTAC